MCSGTLRAWLRALEPPRRVDGVSMLDGCLTTVIIGLGSIPPTEWFVDLLGQHCLGAHQNGPTFAHGN